MTAQSKANDKMAKLLEELDRLDTQKPTKERREHQRYTYRRPTTVSIRQPGDGIAQQHVMQPRNLCSAGIAFLHGGFVHLGSRCTVQLITMHGNWHEVDGTVASCRFVSGRFHELGIRFDEKIEPSEYCREAISARVLLVDDDPSIVRLATLLLGKINAQVDVAENGRDAVDKAFSNMYDLILMDMEMPELNGFEATKALRDRGYSGKIFAATALTRPEDRQRCLDAGCNGYLAKPYKSAELAKILEGVQQEPIFSSLADDATLADIIATFVSELPARIRAMDEAAVQGNLEQLTTLARSLKAEGTSYGFEVVTNAASKLETAIIEGVSIDDVRPLIDGLVQLCNQVRMAGI